MRSYRVGSLREEHESLVLVEGESDRNALEALAERLGRDLAAEGVVVEPIGGAHAVGRFLERFGPRGLDVRLAGLYDAGEEVAVKRSLERAGMGSDLTRAAMERLGFYACVEDLEDELIRSLGTSAVEKVVAAQGELRSFGPSSGSRLSGTSRSSASCGASWALTAGARSTTAGCSSRRLTSPACRGPSTSCSRM